MYKDPSELPVNVRDKYSDKALRVYMETFNAVYLKVKDEPRSFAAAASAADKIDGVVPKPTFEKGVNPFAKTPGKEAEFMEASFYFDGEFNEAPQYDEDTHRYQIPVTLIKPGLSKNKVYYSEAWLAKFAEKMDGGKAYLDHEKKSEIKDRSSRSVKDVAGWYSDVKQDSDMSVKGVLNLVETPQTEHVIKLAKANPSLVGLSINARGKASRGKMNGENAMIAETVERVFSTDIVTEAAAGGEMMQFAASVPMDIEQISPDKTEDIDQKESENMDELKDTATWLVAESQYKADVTAWLTVESAHKAIDDEKTAKIIESKLAEVPEKWRDHLKDSTPEAIDSFMEVLKDELPEAKTPAAAGYKPEEVAPGEDGYTRKLL